VYVSPFDVRLKTDTENDTVVQPDIVVVCDRAKLDDKGCLGTPDLIVEVVSPSSDKHDRILKFRQYLDAGVREYWIVSPESQSVHVHILENGKYVTSVYSDSDMIPSQVLEGCTILLEEVFAE
jgi:Uma2 family endonuclease